MSVQLWASSPSRFLGSVGFIRRCSYAGAFSPGLDKVVHVSHVQATIRIDHRKRTATLINRRSGVTSHGAGFGPTFGLGSSGRHGVNSDGSQPENINTKRIGCRGQHSDHMQCHSNFYEHVVGAGPSSNLIFNVLVYSFLSCFIPFSKIEHELITKHWQSSTSLEEASYYPQYPQYEGTRGREQMLADQPDGPAYRVFLKSNQVGQAQTQQLPMYGYAPYPPTQIHVSAPAPLPVAPVAQTIRPVFNVIPNPGSADALRRVQNQMAAQRIAMAQLKENLGYVLLVHTGEIRR